MKRFVRIFIAALLTGVFVMTSCSYERDLISYTDPSEEGMSEISFLVDLPQSTQVTTRGEVGSAVENAISNIYVLVFDKTTEKLISKSKGKNLDVASDATKDNKVTFKATLPVGQEYIFMVLANAETELAGIDVKMDPEKTKYEVLQLVKTQISKWDTSSSPIPMWGEQNLTLTASDTPSFQLTRMLARINVEVNLKEISPGVTKDNFKLTSVRYYNYNTAGAIAADVTNHSSQEPTIPVAPGTQTGSALLYNGTDIDNNQSCKEKIYVFEAAHNSSTYNDPADNDDWINNPCLVIGGKYKTDDDTWLDETFYRVDFIRKDKTNPNDVKDIWLSILRNFSYNVVITEVSGSGFPDEDIALRSAPINMEANVLEWDESGMGEIVFDGVFYLSVSRDELTVVSSKVDTKKEENIVYIKTDYVYNNDPAASGWHIDKYTDDQGNTLSDSDRWLTLNPAHGDPDDLVEAYFTFEENDTNVLRTAIVWVAAGRLRYPIKVTQKLAWIQIVDPTNNDVPLSKLHFEVPVGGSLAEQKPFKVIWGPTNQPVAVSQDSPKSWAPFDASWITPNPIAGIPANNGSMMTYTVKAPAVDQAMIDEDPFYERESVYTFSVGSGVDEESASITLHQIYYNIVVDIYSYKLDGKTYTMSVRSNTEWEIADIKEWLHNEGPGVDPSNNPPVMLNLQGSDNLRVGTSGGPNLSGESVSFTVVDQAVAEHKQKWGTVYVTFVSPTGKFDPVKIAIRFPARKMTILGLGYSIDDRCYNPAFPSGYHRQGTNRMITADVNFGPDGTFQTEGFNIVGFNCQDLSDPNTGQDPQNFAGKWRKGFLKSWLNIYNPDIIFITYSVVLDADESKLIKEYLKNGGAAIMYYGANSATSYLMKPFMDELFDYSFTAGVDANIESQNLTYRAAYPTTGAVYRYENTDDPILNGPFGDIRGQLWGIHGERAFIRTSVIKDKIHVLSSYAEELIYPNYTYPDFSLAFRHKEYNLVWVGNSMGTAGYYPTLSPAHYDPMKIDNDFRPIPRPGFRGLEGPSTTYTVYNSIFFANAVAWAITVTNHVAPAGGY